MSNNPCGSFGVDYRGVMFVPFAPDQSGVLVFMTNSPEDAWIIVDELNQALITAQGKIAQFREA